MLRRRLRAAVAVLALAVIAMALWHLEGATRGLAVSRLDVAGTPATVYARAGGAPAPVIVVAHGFAGSQQLMQPFATTLARAGYVAVTYDALGHGRNPKPLTGDLTAIEGATRALVAELDAVVAAARALPGGDGRVALLGHSMASDIVVRAARADPSIGATIAVSMFSPALTPTSPRNLLVIVGALEPAMLRDAGLAAVRMVAGDAARAGVTYGRVADGTARRFVLSPGVEHIGVLYGAAGLAEAVAWLDAVFGRVSSVPVDTRGPWLGLVLLGVVALAWCLSAWLPRVAQRPLGASAPWRTLGPVALAPAVLTPLVLWAWPPGLLPLLLGDYLAAHFAVYGVLTALGLWLTRGPRALPRSLDMWAWGRLALGAALASAYGTLVLGWPLDRYAASFVPSAARLPFLPIVLAGTLPYFLADEWLTRGAQARRGAYAATKLAFLLSLAGAVAVDLEQRAFLIIIVPVVLLFFLLFGLFSAWAYRATGHPWVGAVANAAALAWAVTVTFPLIAG